MKKFLISLILAFAASSILHAAGETDVRISFYTEGPDRYQDGTSVLTNEFYTLVWAKKGTDFYGFNADCSLVSNGVNEVLALCPKAKRRKKDPECGYLPTCGATVPLEKATKMADGSLYIVLLDTRKADRTLSQQLDSGVESWSRKPLMVKGYTNVVCMTTAAAELSGQFGITSPITVSLPSLVPEDTPRPVVSSVSFRDEPSGRKMVICVTNTVAYLSYFAKGQSLGGDSPIVPESFSAADGRQAPADEIEIVVPAAETKGFFKVTEQH